jgi:hypothetical protein
LIDENTYKRPALAVLLHPLQQLHGPRPVQQKVLVHHEERLHTHALFHVLHHIEELIARLVEVIALALAAEECRRRAEVAAHGATDRRNNRGRGVARIVGYAHAQDAKAKARQDLRVHDRRVWILAKIPTHPHHALAAHDVMGIDHVLDPGNPRDMSTNYDHRLRRQPPRPPAHLLHLAEVGNDAGDSDDVIVVCGQFALKRL